MVAHRLSTFGGSRCSPQVFSHRCSVTLAQHFQKSRKKLHTSMPHATPKEMTLGDCPDPDLEVSLIQQRERFKRSLARVDLLDTPEISWLGAVARIQARTSTAMVRREQHKRFQEWVLSASNPRAPRGTGVGKLHRHVNGPNVARSLCQVCTEGRVLRSIPSALMGVREAVWAKRWQRDAPDSVAIGSELVAQHFPRISIFWSLFPSTSWTKPYDASQTTQDSVAIVSSLEPSSTHLLRPNWNSVAFWTAS